MDKQKAIEFLTEQREYRLFNNDHENPSDFDKWQLEQARQYQEVIDWIEGVEIDDTKLLEVED